MKFWNEIRVQFPRGQPPGAIQTRFHVQISEANRQKQRKKTGARR